MTWSTIENFPVAILFTTPVTWVPTATIWANSMGGTITLKTDGLHSSSTTKGVIAGLALAGLILMVLCGWLLWSRVRNSRAKKAGAGDGDQVVASDNPRLRRQGRVRDHGPTYGPDAAAQAEELRERHANAQATDSEDDMSEIQSEAEPDQQRGR